MCGLTVLPGSIASATLSKDTNTTGFDLTPPPRLGGFLAICGHNYFSSSAFSPAWWWATSCCQSCFVPQSRLWHLKDPSTMWFSDMDGCGASCIRSVFLWLEAILHLGIFEAGAGFLMNLQLVLAKVGTHYLLSCEMEPSKHKRDNCVTREASWKTEQFMSSSEANEWCALDLAYHVIIEIHCEKFVITETSTDMLHRARGLPLHRLGNVFLTQLVFPYSPWLQVHSTISGHFGSSLKPHSTKCSFGYVGSAHFLVAWNLRKAISKSWLWVFFL